jgi:glycosyltransferase involved in cell wall biosynthesis
MRVGVDMSWLGPTGIGRMAQEVMRRRPSSVELCALREGRPNAGVVTPAALAISIRGAGVRKFWSPGFMPPLFGSGIACAVTVHDLTHLHYYGKKHRLYYDAVIRPLLRRLDVIFTVSDYTAGELREWSGIDAGRIVRVHNGVDPAFNPDGPKTDIGRPYVLYAGNRRGYKNVRGLLSAFARSGLAREGYVLGLTGAPDAELAQLAAALGVEKDVHYFGFVPEEELPALYRGAACLAFVSLYEGFGLPIVEAMGCGTPVVTSTASSMPEVAGGAARLVAPTDEAEIASALREVCLDQGLRASLAAAGLARVADFSWDAAAQGYWKTIGSM